MSDPTSPIGEGGGGEWDDFINEECRAAFVAGAKWALGSDEYQGGHDGTARRLVNREAERRYPTPADAGRTNNGGVANG